VGKRARKEFDTSKGPKKVKHVLDKVGGGKKTAQNAVTKWKLRREERKSGVQYNSPGGTKRGSLGKTRWVQGRSGIKARVEGGETRENMRALGSGGRGKRRKGNLNIE